MARGILQLLGTHLRASSIDSSGRVHRHRISRLLLLPDRLPHLQVDLPAPNFWRINGARRFVLAGLSVTDAHKLSVSLQSGLGPPRRSFGVSVVPRDGRERSTMEGANERMKAAYTRYGPPDVLELWAIQKDSSPARAKSSFRYVPSPGQVGQAIYRKPRLRELRFRPANAIFRIARLQTSKDIHEKPGLEDRSPNLLILDNANLISTLT